MVDSKYVEEIVQNVEGVTRREFIKRAITAGLLAGATALGVKEIFAQVPPHVVARRVLSEESVKQYYEFVVYTDGDYAVAVDRDGNVIRSTDHSYVMQTIVDKILSTEYSAGTILVIGTLILKSPIIVKARRYSQLRICGLGNYKSSLYGRFGKPECAIIVDGSEYDGVGFELHLENINVGRYGAIKTQSMEGKSWYLYAYNTAFTGALVAEDYSRAVIDVDDCYPIMRDCRVGVSNMHGVFFRYQTANADIVIDNLRIIGASESNQSIGILMEAKNARPTHIMIRGLHIYYYPDRKAKVCMEVAGMTEIYAYDLYLENAVDANLLIRDSETHTTTNSFFLIYGGKVVLESRYGGGAAANCTFMFIQDYTLEFRNGASPYDNFFRYARYRLKTGFYTVEIGLNNTYGNPTPIFYPDKFPPPVSKIIIDVSDIDTTAGETITVKIEFEYPDGSKTYIEKQITSDGKYYLTDDDLYALLNDWLTPRYVRAYAKTNLSSTTATVKVAGYAGGIV